MSDWRYVSIISPAGDATCTVLKGDQLPASLLDHLGTLGFSIELGAALSDVDAHRYNRLHKETKASPTFGWYPAISSGEEP